jgi:hypothetical protein
VCADRLGNVLRRHYAAIRHAPKLASASIGVTPRTFQNLLYGNNAPQAHVLIALMAEVDAVRMRSIAWSTN